MNAKDVYSQVGGVGGIIEVKMRFNKNGFELANKGWEWVRATVTSPIVPFGDGEVGIFEMRTVEGDTIPIETDVIDEIRAASR